MDASIYVAGNYQKGVGGEKIVRIRKVSNDRITPTILKNEFVFRYFKYVYITLDNFGNLLMPAKTDSINIIKKLRIQFNMNPINNTCSYSIIHIYTYIKLRQKDFYNYILQYSNKSKIL